MQVAREFGLRENLATIFRHRRKILTVFVMTVFVALAGSYLVSKVYQAQARVLVQMNREPLRLSPAIGPASVASAVLSPQDEIITEIEIFRSPQIADQLVAQLGADTVLTNMRWRWDFLREYPARIRRWALDTIWSFEPVRELLESFGLRYAPGVPDPAVVAAAKIRDNLEVFPIPKASVFEVQFESPRPEFAALVLNTLVELYLELHLDVRRPTDVSEFYTAEAQLLRDQLQAAEERLQAFKLETGIFSIDSQIGLLLERLDRLEGERAEAHLRAAEADELIAGTRQQLAEQDQNVQISQVRSPSPVAEELRLKIMSLELERARYAIGSPSALRLEEEIADARTRFANARGRVIASETSGVSQAYQDLQSRLVTLEGNRRAYQATLSLIDGEMGELRDELRRLDQQGVILRTMNREVDLKEETLTLYIRKTEETRVDALLDERKVSNVRPIEVAGIPVGPVRPRKLINIALGVAAGVIGGLGLAYLSEFFRRTLATREEAEQALGQPVLASVLQEKGRSRGRRENILEFRRLAESLAQLRRQRGVSKVLLSSAHRHEGKSFIGQCLAGALAQQGKKVLLVDADFSDLESAGGQTSSSCTTAAVLELTPTVAQPKPTKDPNTDKLNVIGLHGENEGNLHDLYRWTAEAVDRCADRYDYVIVESSALDSNPEQLLVAAEIGAVVFVVESDRTPAITANQSIDQLRETGATILGVVLNKRRHVIPNWAYRWLLSSRKAHAA